MSAIRVYGETCNGSFAQVAAGLQEAAKSRGLLAGFVPVRAVHDEWTEHGQGYIDGPEAPVSICSADPPAIPLMHTLGLHKKHWHMLAPNSEGIPDRLVEFLMSKGPLGHGKLLDGVLVPSQWARGVIEKHLEGLPIVVAPHGVRRIYKPRPAARRVARESHAEGRFHVLHITSSGKQRKGTEELLRAWKRLLEVDAAWGRAKLVMLCHALAITRYRMLASRLGLPEENVIILPGLAMTDESVVDSYATAHILCQPSRGEGFGMVPLEARACGVPVIATACTGHSEHIFREGGKDPPGVVVVPHGELDQSDDYPGARTPIVEWRDVMWALQLAREEWKRLDEEATENADSIRNEWSWPNTSGPALEQIAREAQEDT